MRVGTCHLKAPDGPFMTYRWNSLWASVIKENLPTRGHVDALGFPWQKKWQQNLEESLCCCLEEKTEARAVLDSLNGRQRRFCKAKGSLASLAELPAFSIPRAAKTQALVSTAAVQALGSKLPLADYDFLLPLGEHHPVSGHK